MSRKVKGITALAPWFGSNRMLAHHIGELMRGYKWVGVPFAGGMTELLYIDASTLVVSDKHGWIINLAKVVADELWYPRLKQLLKCSLFHPEALRISQQYCREFQPNPNYEDVIAAYHYFICAWMGRSAKAGTDHEFEGALPVRWTGVGGDSCTRFRSAVRSLVGWRQVFRRANFHTLDVFEFLDKCKDFESNGIYCDPPFPDAGNEYRHKFTPEQHRQLAGRLAEFKETRVVCRFYDHQLIRELYPSSIWDWRFLEGRKQSNSSAPEVLLVNRSSL